MLAPTVSAPLALAVAVFCGVSAALATWSLPRVRFESPPDATGLPVRSLLTGGVGGVVVLAFLPPRFVLGLALGVRLALGAITAAAALLGVSGCATAVVLVERGPTSGSSSSGSSPDPRCRGQPSATDSATQDA